MKQFLLTALFLLAALIPAKGQVDQFYLEARAGYAGAISGGKYNGGFNADHLNLILGGHITPSVSYYWRQRFTKPLYDPKNALNATDMLWIQWQASERWAFQAGKMAIMAGGYEFDDAPVDLYYWNLFSERTPQVYALGACAWYTLTPGQQLSLQVCQSPLAAGQATLLHAGLLWHGGFAPWWQTMWGVNWVDDPAHLGVCWLGLGNRLEAGPLAIELDFMYRHSLRQGAPKANLSSVCKLDLTLSNWTIFAKGGADYNAADNANADGTSWDPIVPAGTRYFYAGGGLEFFPLRNDDMRLHAVAWVDNLNKAPSFSVGLTYRFRIVKYLAKL